MDVVDTVLRRTHQPPDEAAMARLGRRLAALFHSWRGGVDLPDLIDQLLHHTGVEKTAPLGRTAQATGVALLRWVGHPYHSVRHTAEVTTSAMVLAELGVPALPPGALTLLLCAALAHDLDFDPVQAASGRFAAERRSAAALDAIAAAAGVAPEERRVLRLLILATEPLARGGLRTLLRTGVPHPDRWLRGLAARPEALALAAVLSDADMLPSSGLTGAWSAAQEARLSAEWGRPFTRADRLHYFGTILGPDYLSPGGSLFLANLRHIRAAALA